MFDRGLTPFVVPCLSSARSERTASGIPPNRSLGSKVNRPMIGVAMSHSCTLTLVAALSFVLGAEPDSPKPGKADVRGIVTRITPINDRPFLGRLLIEGKKEEDTTHAKASVLVVKPAQVYF